MLNARSLLVDSRLLLKQKRHRAAKILAILALEEVGRAQLAVEHMKAQKDVTYKEYTGAFLDHKSKIEAAQKALNPEEGAWDFRTMLYQDEKFNEQYVDYDWEFKSWTGPRSMDQKLSDTRFEGMFRLTGGDKAEEEFNELREAGAGIDEGFVDQLIDEAEKGLDAIDHLLTEDKDKVMVSLLALIRQGSMNTPLNTKQTLELVEKAGVHPKEGELQKSIDKYVKWGMLKRSRSFRVRYAVTEFGIIGVPKIEPKIRIPPRRFTLSWLEKLADSLEAKRVELAGLIARTRYAELPALSLDAPINTLRKGIKEHGESPGVRRVLTKMLVDELRRDVYSKYLYAMDIAEGDNDYLKALAVMNEYAISYGIPFARRRWYPSFVKRLMNNLYEKRRKPPFDAVQLWRDSYRECLGIMKSRKPTLEDLKKYHLLQSNLSWLNFYSE